MIKLFTPLFVFLNRAVVAGLVFVLVVPITIIAFYSDIERLDNQTFTATQLHWASLPKSGTKQYFSPTFNTEHIFTLPTAFTTSSTKALYDISTAVSGDLDFCSTLQLSAEGYLGSISAGASYFETGPLTSGTSWQVKLIYDALESNFAHGAECDVVITVEGWQKNMTKVSAGYRDTYVVTIPVVAQMVVLNEVLAKPTPGGDEFIELYNHSAYPVDVAGFNITEKTAGGVTNNHIIRSISLGSTDLVAYDSSGNTVIPAHGFLALRYSGNTSYLNDTGDTITLLDTDNITLDNYTFGPAVVNKSDARIPDGTGPWIDPTPTPNEPNTITLVEIAEIPTVDASLTELEDVILIVNELASGTDPIITPVDESLPGEEEIEEVVDEEVAEEAEDIEVDESIPDLEVLLETPDENLVELESVGDEAEVGPEEINEEIKAEEVKEEKLEKEELVVTEEEGVELVEEESQ